ERLTEKIEREIGPTFDHLNKIARDASHAVALATAQIERADRLFTDLSKRVEDTVSTFQATLAGPAREGIALFNALRAALDVIRSRVKATLRPSTSRTTCAGRAPSAIRTPISWVRRVTEYASTPKIPMAASATATPAKMASSTA